MNKQISRLKQFSKISNSAIIADDSYYYIFGQDKCDSLFVDGLMNKPVKKMRLVQLRAASKLSAVDDASVDRIEDVRCKIDRVNKISQGAIEGSFMLTKAFWIELIKLVKDNKSTHIQFETDGDTAAAHVFDIVATHGRSSWRESYVAGVVGVPLVSSSGSCIFTSRADAFLSLPYEAATVSIYASGIMRLVYSKDGTRVTIRDQEIRKPFTQFISESNGTNVIFLFQPND
jgi:hypothetical protein